MTRKRGGSGKGPLTDDDEAVWAHTARSLSPLKKAKARVHPAVPEEADGVVFAPRSKGAAHAALAGTSMSAHEASTAKAGAKKAGAKKAAPELQPFDQKRAKKLRAGRIEIDARIDLHGMKQTEAHATLRRFLLGSHHDGLRTVLVITGKGGPAAGGRDDERHWTRGHERGVLKRNVPHWLAEPELRRIIVSFTTASVRHGGEGALYVHLRSASKLGGV